MRLARFDSVSRAWVAVSIGLVIAGCASGPSGPTTSSLCPPGNTPPVLAEVPLENGRLDVLPVPKVGDCWKYVRGSVMVVGMQEELVIYQWDTGARTYQKPQTNETVRRVDVSGNDTTFTPAFKDFDPPLFVSKQWTFLSPGQRGRNTFYVTVTVEALEDVQVVAGKFRAFKMVLRTRPSVGFPWEQSRTYWYSPEVRNIVKFEDAGFGAYKNELESYSLK